jgi:hypothetical protein
MPTPCRWRNTHQSKKIVILYLKETGIDIKSSVNQNTHTHACVRDQTSAATNLGRGLSAARLLPNLSLNGEFPTTLV